MATSSGVANVAQDEDYVEFKGSIKYKGNPYMKVMLVPISIWIIIFWILWYLLEKEVLTSAFWSFNATVVFYCLFLYRYFWTYTESDKILTVQRLLGRNTTTDFDEESGRLEPQESVRALSPGLNCVWFEHPFGPELDTTTKALCEDKVTVKDSKDGFFTIEFTGPVRIMKGWPAANAPFFDDGLVKELIKGVYERAIAKGVGEGDGYEIIKNPMLFTQQYLRPLFKGVTKIEVMLGRSAGTPFIKKVTATDETTAIAQISARGREILNLANSLIGSGIPADQVATLVFASTGQHFDLSQLNVGGQLGAATAALAQSGAGGQSGQPRRRKGRKGGNTP